MTLFNFFLFLLSLLPPCFPRSPALGVAFSPKTSSRDVPSSDRLVSALRHAGICRLLVKDADPSLIDSLKGTDISVVIDLENLTLNYTDYIISHLLPFLHLANISAILLGRDDDPDDVITAITSLRSTLGLPPILISTVLFFSVALDPYFQPSAARL